jgi:hypothetical protein
VFGVAVVPIESTINTRHGRCAGPPHAFVVAAARNSAQNKTVKVWPRVLDSGRPTDSFVSMTPTPNPVRLRAVRPI